MCTFFRSQWVGDRQDGMFIVPVNTLFSVVPNGLSKTCRDAMTALMAVDASSAVPSSVPASIDANCCPLILPIRRKVAP